MLTGNMITFFSIKVCGEGVVFDTERNGKVAKFSGVDNYGKGTSLWQFKAYNDVADRIEHMKVKAGSRLVIPCGRLERYVKDGKTYEVVVVNEVDFLRTGSEQGYNKNSSHSAQQPAQPQTPAAPVTGEQVFPNRQGVSPSVPDVTEKISEGFNEAFGLSGISVS